ncbi:MAG: glutamate--cysteine ligase [Rhodospirillales bacterium]|nr:MAG: glutamate--cysteine ligase [Rhodospirillales bacterium]
MSGAAEATSEPITDRRQLVQHLEAGCKPKVAWRIGTEHEKFAYRLDNLRPLPYDGDPGIRTILDQLAAAFGWQPVLEDGLPLALKDDGGCSITLEPAGQVELSGAPLADIHQTCGEVSRHLNQVKSIGAAFGIGFLGVGYQPKWPLAEMPWMPKGRYAIMRRYMPTRGRLGLEMMQATCTVQVNLDFDSEATMVEMYRIGLALQPVATALFANSPFKEGRPTGYLSYRAHVWTDVDPDRTGVPGFVFEDGFGFERYVEYALDVPMYFVYRHGRYVDVAGQSFREFLAGRLPGLPGEYPTLADWDNHLTTLFPEVRLKRFLEMRGADGGPWARLCALPALWAGLLYDDEARRAAGDLIADWTREERRALARDVPRLALSAEFRGGTVADLALTVLEIARDGLERRGVNDGLGQTEAKYLIPMFRIAESRFTPAEDLLAAYNRRWRGSVDPLFREYAY